MTRDQQDVMHEQRLGQLGETQPPGPTEAAVGVAASASTVLSKKKVCMLLQMCMHLAYN
jgi:hypothetical protein